MINIDETAVEEYGMSHRPTKSAPSYDLSEIMPKDVYVHPEWYFMMNNDEYGRCSRESFRAVLKVRNKPDADITIYRATIGNEINEGDWVTLSKSYAEMHSKHCSVEGKQPFPVVSLTCKAKDAWFAGDDINEFGYFPE